MSVFARAALAYAEQDLYVLPLKPREKVPLTAHGLEDATTDALTVETWWARWPSANVGIRTGEVVVIDEDKLGALQQLADSAGETIPPTRVARTGSGRHYYFTQPSGVRIRNTAGKLAAGIDTRGDGGYVVAPPSVHPSGAAYTWESEADPAPFPDWIAQRLYVAPPAREPLTPITAQPGTTPYGQRALEQETHAVASAPEGTRNHRLNAAAFALGQLVAGGEVDHHDAAQSLHAAARACGLAEREAQATIKSGFSSGLADPRQAPERVTTVARSSSPASTPEQAARLIAIETWRDFSLLASSPTDFLVSDLWATQSLGFIASPPKKGKTWIGLSLALAVATGQRFLATFDTPKPRRVLYLALEGNRSALKARVATLARGLNLEPDPSSRDLENLIFSYKPRAIDLADPAWGQDLTAVVAEHNIELVIVDVLRNAARIKEQDASEFADLAANLAPTLALSSIALLHHFIKLSDISKERTPGERMSGSGAMFGAMDIGLFITGSEDHARRLRVEFDGRDIAMPDPVSVYLEGEGHGPNQGFTYSDTAFWRGDIDEIDEADLAVPSILVIDIVREHGQIRRADLVKAIADQLPEAKERTIIARIEKLAGGTRPTLIRPARGFYALHDGETDAHDAHSGGWASEPHEQDENGADAHDAHRDQWAS